MVMLFGGSIRFRTATFHADHVHMFISVPPQIALSKVMMRIKGRSSYKIQREFPELRKRYWGQRFWARGFFSTTSGNVTDTVILQCLEFHSKREPTGLS
jgi:putative transposase